MQYMSVKSFIVYMFEIRALRITFIRFSTIIGLGLLVGLRSGRLWQRVLSQALASGPKP